VTAPRRSPETPLHQDALALLGDWDPPDATQAALRDRFVAHLRARPDGLDRDCHPDHVTASTLVLSSDATHVLLTLHAKAHRWFQLGGHCEPGDPALAAAAEREAVEESGIAGLRLQPTPVQLEAHAVPFCGARGGVTHLDVRFVAVATVDDEHAVSEESLDLRWWPVDALPGDDLSGLVECALARVGQSTSSPGGGSTREAADHPSR
jgi:8-oxo-dGTP pyrophosphatase MutT (NUDIX family)